MVMVQHGGVQADMVLQKELRFLHIVTSKQQEVVRVIGHEHIWDLEVCLHSDTLLQQGHTYSNKAIPPNSDTPFLGGIFFQTTTGFFGKNTNPTNEAAHL